VAPTSRDDVARALVALQNDNVRSDLVARGAERAKCFSWDESARKHADVYMTVAHGS
jgi:hypothetical protein